jgi:drug/metabolite transporter (DMT)-like permease
MSAFLSSVTWAIGITTYSHLSRRFAPPAINLARVLISLPLFFLVVAIEGRTWSGFVGEISSVLGIWYWLLLSVLTSYAVGDLLFMWSTHSMGVPGALAIASTYPLWSALGGWIFKGETLNARGLAGLLLIVGGTCAVILSGRGEDPSPERGEASLASEKKLPWIERYSSGVILAALTSVFWSLNAFALSKVPFSVSSAASNGLRMSMGLVLVPLLGRFLVGRSRLVVPCAELRRSWWVFVIEAFGGASFFVYGLSHSPLAIGSALTSLAPVLSVPVALVYGREKFSWTRVSGVVSVVLGIWFLLSRAS